ncbi:MAG: hypothetical protein PVF26_12985 [Desulfobacterales bacterium]|jgi:hypothetical protein
MANADDPSLVWHFTEKLSAFKGTLKNCSLADIVGYDGACQLDQIGLNYIPAND